VWSKFYTQGLQVLPTGGLNRARFKPAKF